MEDIFTFSSHTSQILAPLLKIVFFFLFFENTQIFHGKVFFSKVFNTFSTHDSKKSDFSISRKTNSHKFSANFHSSDLFFKKLRREWLCGDFEIGCSSQVHLVVRTNGAPSLNTNILFFFCKNVSRHQNLFSTFFLSTNSIHRRFSLFRTEITLKTVT